MTDNIRAIDAGKPDKRRAAIEALQRMLEGSEVMQEALLVARLRKIHFDAHLSQGFTREEALRLVMGVSS
jgi:hypothetical protein